MSSNLDFLVGTLCQTDMSDGGYMDSLQCYETRKTLRLSKFANLECLNILGLKTGYGGYVGQQKLEARGLTDLLMPDMVVAVALCFVLNLSAGHCMCACDCGRFPCEYGSDPGRKAPRSAKLPRSCVTLPVFPLSLLRS